MRPGSLTPSAPPGRRMAHEPAVHRADAELAPGREASFAPDLAADAIDERLGFLSGPIHGGQDPRLGALPDGAVLHVHATDDGLDEAGEWLVRREGPELRVAHGHGKGDVALRGPAARLLLVLVRRGPPGEPHVPAAGGAALLTGWLAGTPY